MADPQVTTRHVVRIDANRSASGDDAVAVERPLEIRVRGRSLAVTLRTPGHDDELTLGFLAGESVIRSRADVDEIVKRPASCADEPDVADVTLAAGVTLDWTRLERHFTASAACGLCGRAHLESLRAGLEPVDTSFRLDPQALAAWPDRLRASQAAFQSTGGIHAAAFAGQDLEPAVLREDVGRHNAVDKVVGWLLERSRVPARDGVLWVSGRAGAEIVLKAARAGIPVLAAVGAPSSLAIDLAETARMTLVGFLREGRMTVYSGVSRLGVST
jgi:FdhD protein